MLGHGAAECVKEDDMLISKEGFDVVPMFGDWISASSKIESCFSIGGREFTRRILPTAAEEGVSHASTKDSRVGKHEELSASEVVQRALSFPRHEKSVNRGCAGV